MYNITTIIYTQHQATEQTCMFNSKLLVVNVLFF